LYLGSRTVDHSASDPLARNYRRRGAAYGIGAAGTAARARSAGSGRRSPQARRSGLRAAELCRGDALVPLGNLYAEGQGVAQDYGEALGWFRKAADQGNYEAQNNIGWFYLSGWGVTQDYGEAMRWFRLAADQGNEIAQRNIGMMYVQGLGVTIDKDEAIRWFKKAAAAGDDESKDALKQLGAE
jgi:TPR repeat protein